MKQHAGKIQLITAISFCLLYIDGDKISWFMGLYLPAMILLTGGWTATPLIKISHHDDINTIVSLIYLLLVLLSVVILFWTTKTNKRARLSIIANLFMLTLVYQIFNKETFGHILSIVSLSIFLIFSTLSIIVNIQLIRKGIRTEY
jgi:DMSO/TMAO reductase YedYZ heme-binding membrane subunit